MEGNERKISENRYFSRICREAPKFCMSTEMADLITRANFDVYKLRVRGMVYGDRMLASPIIMASQSRRKDPPYLPVGGGPHACSGASFRRRTVPGTPKCEKSVGRRGSAPDPAGGSLQRSPRPLADGDGAPSPRTPLTILSLCLSCVYVHTCDCMKMQCYFLLNVKHGASQLYLGGGLQLSSAGTVASQSPL